MANTEFTPQEQLEERIAKLKKQVQQLNDMLDRLNEEMFPNKETQDDDDLPYCKDLPF